MGMRWRSEKEVISGKGHFSCGARGCDESRGLATYEVPFGYEEAGQKKQALVKVRSNTHGQHKAGRSGPKSPVGIMNLIGSRTR